MGFNENADPIGAIQPLVSWELADSTKSGLLLDAMEGVNGPSVDTVKEKSVPR
jgi:hypothetical protein